MYHIFPKHGRKRRYTGKIRSFTSVNAPYTISVFRRISAYTITVKYDRNTVTCNTAKYDRIRSVYGMYTVVYGTVYDRLRQYTESVTIDLGYFNEKNTSDDSIQVHAISNRIRFFVFEKLITMNNGEYDEEKKQYTFILDDIASSLNSTTSHFHFLLINSIKETTDTSFKNELYNTSIDIQHSTAQKISYFSICHSP